LPRTRTTKKLAQRIDLDYFKRPSPLRRWRFLLSVAAPAFALLGIAWYGVRSDPRVYSAGGLSTAHAVLTKQCSACHLSNLGFYDKKVIDPKCLTCHDGPLHHKMQAFTPPCAACHSDHRGAIRLAATSDANCTQCHADLATHGSTTRYVRNIGSFESNHPEFAILRSQSRDSGTIQLNHYLHLQPNLLGPNGSHVQMVCTDCHRSAADAAVRWPFGDLKSQEVTSRDLSSASPKNESSISAPSRAYMAPATYAQTCAGCHTLQFDKRLTDAVPHDKPEVIHSFVVSQLQVYIAAHPEDLRVPRDPSRDLPEQPIPADYRVLTPPQWVGERAAEDETLLWRKTCKQCHTVIFDTGATIPKIAPSNITPRYMPHANFDHSQHGLVDCASCHAAAATSQQSSDVLLPGIATCRACHHAGAEAAESRCFECHTYHDPTQRKPAHSNFSVAELQGRAR
jgi:mono/diheme cytochrome c family protein